MNSISRKRGIESTSLRPSFGSRTGGSGPTILKTLVYPEIFSDEYCEKIRANSSIGTKGYTVPKHLMTASDLSSCKIELALEKEVDRNSPVLQNASPTIMYRENDKKIYLPRFWAINRYGFPAQLKLNPLKLSTEIDIVFNGTLRDNQVTVCNKYLDHVKKTPMCGGGLLSMYCAGGKTVLAINIVTRLRQRALIVVHKTFLADQWKERISEFARRSDSSLPKVGRIQGNVFEVDDCDFVICMLQTLYSRDFPENTFAGFGIMIVDETHRICSEQFSKALFKINVPFTLGISATMKRKDGMERILEMCLGPILHDEERKSNDDPVAVRCIEFRPAVSNSDYEEDILDFRGKIQYASMMGKICAHDERMEFIFRIICDLRLEDPAKQIMVLSFTKGILNFLQKRIVEEDIGTVGFYVGGMKEKGLSETEGKNIILATYAMAQEGLDIPSLSTLVFATPKTDIIQSVGRILRRKDNNPLIIDVVDVHRVFKNQFRARQKYYKKCNYRVFLTQSKCYAGMNEDWDGIADGLASVKARWKCINKSCEIGSDCDSDSEISKKVCLI